MIKMLINYKKLKLNYVKNWNKKNKWVKLSDEDWLDSWLGNTEIFFVYHKDFLDFLDFCLFCHSLLLFFYILLDL